MRMPLRRIGTTGERAHGSQFQRLRQTLFAALSLLLAAIFGTVSTADDVVSNARLSANYAAEVRPLLKRFCFECHADDLTEADVDLGAFNTADDVLKDIDTWMKVRAILNSRQMPPKEADQPSDVQRVAMQSWVNDFLRLEAEANAGDPGPLLMRRLNNEEYNYVVRDLTGVETLNPTREFPVDGAAGEGFINSGEAQSMSPSLVTKYLDAAREVAAHAVLTPSGVTFSTHVSRRDWTDERVAAIQQLYDRFSEPSDVPVEVGGTGRVPNEGGTIPLAKYMAAAVEEFDALSNGETTIESVAKRRSLNGKYLGSLWKMLSGDDDVTLLLQQVRERWRVAVDRSKPKADRDRAVDELTRFVTAWQNELFKYNVIGHIGRDGKFQPWLDSQDPVASQREFRLALPEEASKDVTIYLAATDAEVGTDHNSSDYVLWRNPRLVADGRPDIPLSKLNALQQRLAELQRDALSRTVDYLAAVTELQTEGSDVTSEVIVECAARHELNASVLNAWAVRLGVGPSQSLVVSGLFEKTEIHGDYDFIRSWGTGETPSIGANSTDQQVRVPGIAKPHTVFAHPSPTLYVAAGWKSPVDGEVKVTAHIADAHPDCGDGQEWFLQHRTKRQMTTVWEGKFGKAGSSSMELKTFPVRRGELISFILGPGTNYYCDLTELSLTITEVDGEQREWDLAADVSPDILASNPHADRFGNAEVWHFYRGELKSVREPGNAQEGVPVGSLLESWLVEEDPAEKKMLAELIDDLVNGDAPPDRDSAAGKLYRHIHELTYSAHGIDELLGDIARDERFGTRPPDSRLVSGGADEVRQTDLIVKAPNLVEFNVSSRLAAGRAFVADAALDPRAGKEGSVRVEASLSAIDPEAIGVNSSVLVNDGSRARERLLSAFEDFRQLFPAQLCYRRIVPVDEVVTLTLFYRQDDNLRRLMLTDGELRELNEKWDELLFVAQEPLQYEVAFEQIREFATQDRPDLVTIWDPLKPSVVARAQRFRERLVETQPHHVEAVLKFASRAWRRPLTSDEDAELRELYHALRSGDLSHGESIRLLITRVLTSPTFLYRRETPSPGNSPQPVSPVELASRLSFFLWSSTPDDELMAAALNGSLSVPDALQHHARRMLQDARARRLAEQFACQWLHLRDFDQNDDKNESLYPEFRDLRNDMYEETVRFFTDMFRSDGSILDILSADHTFLNERLSRHYGIDGVDGEQWRRVENVRDHSRGGLLGMATVLASQSGASRTSPILRGNWIYETLLGERLPRPPANVPQLPETVPTGLTARQLIEKHSSDAACAKCHRLIDPYGFALEQFDAIGRRRTEKVDTSTTLVDGLVVNGIDGLRNYLVTARRDDIVRQFCRKLLGFSLGRELILSDEVLIEDMLQQLRENDFRFSVAVDAIISSRQFTHIRPMQTEKKL